MESRVSKGIEIAANIAIIIAAILLSFLLIKNYLTPAASLDALTSENSSIDIRGRAVALDGVDWAASEKTLVLVLSTTCRFCTESMPFYKKLVETNSGLKTVAVLPQPVEEAKRYLEGHSVPVFDVRNATLESLGIDGTPTLLLVGRDGKVIESWRGKLDAAKESEVADGL